MRNVSSLRDRLLTGTSLVPCHATLSLQIVLLAAIVAFSPGMADADTLPLLAQQQQGEQAEVAVPTREEADLVLDLAGAVEVALDRSFAIYQLQQNHLQFAYSLESVRRSLRTNVRLTSSGLPNISQRIIPQLIGVPPELSYLRSNTMAANLQLLATQPLITDGLVYFSAGMNGNQGIQDLPNDLQSKNRSIQPFAVLGFNQPLFQYNQIKGDLRENELSFEQIRLRYTEDEVIQINRVTRDFYSLFQQQRQVEIQAENYRQAGINLATGRRQYQSARSNEVGVLTLRVEQSRSLSDLESAKTELERRRYVFNRAMGLPIETVVWVESALEYEPIAVDQALALERARQNRSDVRQAEIQLERDELQLRETSSFGKPDLELSASYALTGNSNLGALGYGDSWADHLSTSLDADNRSPFTNIQMTLSLPIFDWGYNASRVQRQIAVIQEQERRIAEIEADLAVTVINSIRAVEGAMRQMEILEEQLQIAQTSYTISQQQYGRGNITLTELLRAQDDWNTTQDRHLQAMIDYEMAKADLKEITMWDWETNQPVMQQTTPPVPFGKNG